VGNNATNATDPSGFQGQPQGLPEIKALYEESQKKADAIRKDNPNDTRLMFFDTQQLILKKLANGEAKTSSKEELDWLVRVLQRFMGSLNKAIDGLAVKLDPKTKELTKRLSHKGVFP
jgi:hypothetical protein